MITISLCMIVKNEEEVLGRCLESVKDAVDEIIIVDTGSEDDTVHVASKYSDKIYKYEWHDDFSSARNYAFSKGQGEYLMWLDADDVLPLESREALSDLKANLPETTEIVMMPYESAFDEKGNSTFTYYRERIVRNGRGHEFRGRVHEAMELNGECMYVSIPVRHYRKKSGESDRNLRIYKKMEEEGDDFDARALYYYGRELFFHKDYKKAAAVLKRFFANPTGWKENKIDAARHLATCCQINGDREGALSYLMQTFWYDVPRGEVCCEIGSLFMQDGAYSQAAFWYEQALSAGSRRESFAREGAFIMEECYGYLPAINLCVCYDRMGDHVKAKSYNELAGQWKPDSEHYQANRKYFQNLEMI